MIRDDVRVGLAELQKFATLLALCFGAACSKTESNQVVGDGGVDSSTADGGTADDGSTLDSGADGPRSCQLVDGGCVGAGGCCPYRGYVLNEDGGCLEAAATVLGCFDLGNEGPCACASNESCLVPNDEAGAARVYWRRDSCVYDAAKFRECDAVAEQQAYSASMRPSCP